MNKLMVLAGAATLMTGIPAVANAQSAHLASRMQITTKLNGMSEVPHGDMHGRGTATVRLYPMTGKVCYSITVKSLMGTAVAAHIHKGNVRTSGPVVIQVGTPGKNGRAVGCVKAKTAVIRAIMKSPRNYYINVHTREYSAGAVRGQL